MYFDKCKTLNELAEAIEKTPYYVLMNRQTNMRVKDWPYCIGKLRCPTYGINEIINAPNMERALCEYYRCAKVCVKRLCEETGIELPSPLVIVTEDKPFEGLQNIVFWSMNQAEQKKGSFSHSLTFDELTWNDGDTEIKYTFNKNQAIAIKLLLEANKDPNKAAVCETDIAKVVDTVSDNYRLLTLFRTRRKGITSYHPAWKSIIIHVGNRCYKLKPPV